MPASKESFIVLLIIAGLSLTFLVISSSTSLDYGKTEDFSFNAELDVNGEEGRINVICYANGDWLIRDSQAYECEWSYNGYYNQSLFDEMNRNILEIEWRNLSGHRVSANGAIELEEIDEREELNETWTFDIDTPDMTGVYEFEYTERDNEIEKMVEKRFNDTYIFLDVSDFPREKKTVVSQTKASDIRFRMNSLYLRTFILLSFWFAGFSLIMRIDNSKLPRQKNENIQLLSFLSLISYVIVLAILILT